MIGFNCERGFMKKIIYIIFVFALVFIVSGCGKTDSVKFKKEYENLNGKIASSDNKYQDISIPKKNPIKYATAEEIIDLIKNGSGVIYFGFPECPWCRMAVPALLESAEKIGIEEILYMNMTDERDTLSIDKNGDIITEKKGTVGYKKLLEALEEYLDDYNVNDKDGNSIFTGEKRIYVPLVIFVRNGKIIGTHADTIPVQDENPYMVLNSSQKEELLNIYLELMNQINMCDDTPGC